MSPTRRCAGLGLGVVLIGLPTEGGEQRRPVLRPGLPVASVARENAQRRLEHVGAGDRTDGRGSVAVVLRVIRRAAGLADVGWCGLEGDVRFDAPGADPADACLLRAPEPAVAGAVR